MRTLTKYLLVEVVNGTWKIRNRRPFDSEDEAWYWTDHHYKKDEERLRFYLFEIEVPVMP